MALVVIPGFIFLPPLVCVDHRAVFDKPVDRSLRIAMFDENLAVCCPSRGGAGTCSLGVAVPGSRVSGRPSKAPPSKRRGQPEAAHVRIGKERLVVLNGTAQHVLLLEGANPVCTRPGAKDVGDFARYFAGVRQPAASVAKRGSSIQSDLPSARQMPRNIAFDTHDRLM